MAQYKVIVRKSVSKDLRGLPKKDVIRILECIESLAENPRPTGTKKLSGQERYRLRQGDYRILYSIEDAQLVVWVVKVRHRRDVYR